VLKPTHDALAAWRISVDRLRFFRQGANLGRNPRALDSASPVGRSRWPEPDHIRQLAKKNAKRHVPQDPVVEAFPRAGFGLPIIFHFKDPGEPSDHTLQPIHPASGQKADRMASPLILRPYWDGEHWRPAALLLPGWEGALSPEVGFGDGPYRRAWPDDPAERQRLSSLIKPMAGRGDDPLTAFLDYFERG
jgi:CRISPR-associated protein Cmr1